MAANTHTHTHTPGELYKFTASLGGAQVLPTPVTTNARGSATLVYDDSSRKLTYDIGFQDLTGVTAYDLMLLLMVTLKFPVSERNGVPRV